MALTFDELLEGIRYGDFNSMQLKELSTAIRYANNRLAQKNIWQVTVGDTVQFEGRRGIKCVGTVEKTMTKFVVVNVQHGPATGRWRVRANALTKI